MVEEKRAIAGVVGNAMSPRLGESAIACCVEEERSRLERKGAIAVEKEGSDRLLGFWKECDL